MVSKSAHLFCMIVLALIGGNVKVAAIAELQEKIISQLNPNGCNRTDKVCGCPDDHLHILKLGVGGDCVMTLQCTNDLGFFSECINEKCECTKDAVASAARDYCLPVVGQVGGECKEEQQCTSSLGDLSHCRGGQGMHKCRCKAGAVANSQKTYCLPIVNELEKECFESVQCQRGVPGEDSVCLEGKCKCLPYAYHDPDKHACLKHANLIGDPCKELSQCATNLGDFSECGANGTCHCIANVSVSSQDETRCLEIKNEYGDPCEEDPQCTLGDLGRWSECGLGDVCLCQKDASQNPPNMTHCLKKATYVGDPCEVNFQCWINLGTMATCYENGTCGCIPGSVANLEGTPKTECILGGLSVGDTCFDKAQCPGEPGVASNCIGDDPDRACSCLPGYLISEEWDNCLAIRHEIGEECSESQQCTEGAPGRNSECSKGKCQCVPKFTHEPSDHLCRRMAEHVGDPCVVNNQCKDSLGVPKVVNTIGGECLERLQCLKGVPGDYSDCQASPLIPDTLVCNCSIGAVHQAGQDKCYPVASEIGGPCDVLEQCQVPFSNLTGCEDGTCQCLKGISILSEDGAKCLPIVQEIGAPCKEDSQCTHGEPGSLSECGGDPGISGGKTCVCQKEAVKNPDSNTCFRKATLISDLCEFDLQCTISLGNWSSCHDEGHCYCVNGSRANMEGISMTHCVPSGVLLGVPCYDMAQCVGEPGVTSTCTSGPPRLCGCLTGYVPNTPLEECLPIIKELGGECSEPQQCQQGGPGYYSDCKALNSETDIKVCSCIVDAITEPGKHLCYPKVTHVNDPCEVNIQCEINLEHGECSNDRCECNVDSVPSSSRTKCLPMADLGTACIEDAQCSHVAHAICPLPSAVEPRQCQCNPTYASHPHRPNTCIKIADLVGHSCEDDDSQCREIPGSICLEDKSCGCESTTHVVSKDHSECLAYQDTLLISCKEVTQCRVLNSSCLPTDNKNESSCQCLPSQFVESAAKDTCLPLRTLLGETCEESPQCSRVIGEHTDCYDSRCRCIPPYQAWANNCYKPASLGHVCSVNEECYIGSNNLTRCSQPEYECACTGGAIESSNLCWDIKKVGDHCTTNEECSATVSGPVHCSYKNVCTCWTGYEPEVNGIMCSGATRVWWHMSWVLVILSFLSIL